MDHVTWAINTNRPLEPLIVFTVSTVILIFDVSSQTLVGKLRGHGGVKLLAHMNSTEVDIICSLSPRFLFTPRCLTCLQLRQEISRPVFTTLPCIPFRHQTIHTGFRVQSPASQVLPMAYICASRRVKV